MFKFRMSLYKIWRSFWFVFGFGCSSIWWGLNIRNETLQPGSIWFIVLALGFLLSFPVSIYLSSYSIDKNNFIIFNYLLKLNIPINNIKSLSYEQRPAWRYLVLKYIDKKGKEVGKEWSVDFYDPIVISALNEKLKQYNPSITILFDDKFKDFMEKQKDLHKKAPDTILGWLWFAVRWGGITAIINIGVLELIRYIDPSVFK